jgi:hypothetical protein
VIRLPKRSSRLNTGVIDLQDHPPMIYPSDYAYWQDGTLPSSALRVFVSLLILGADRYGAEVSMVDLAVHCGMSHLKTAKHVQALMRVGLIEIDPASEPGSDRDPVTYVTRG